MEENYIIREERIIGIFELLGISKEEYPEYLDPFSFAEGFQICSLYSEDEAVTSDAAIAGLEQYPARGS